MNLVATAVHQVTYTYAEFRSLEEASNVKHEFYRGQIYAMAGGTPEHAALQAATSALLVGQLRGRNCRAHSSDLRVRVLATGLATYPDVTVVCGPSERDPEDKNNVVNPTLLVEVTSRSSEEYDLGEKFDNYKQIPSLRHYVLVSHRERRIDVWTRDDDDAWSVQTARDGERGELVAIAAALDVKELYDIAAEPTA